MTTPNKPYADFMATIQAKFGERMRDYQFPPPVFTAMQGEFLEFDLSNGTLKARFPIRQSYLNPYGSMQGGMIAAAVDNTLGPLSVALASPNVTRTLELKYSHPVLPEMGYIIVHARLVDRDDPRLTFQARVSSPDGKKLATCKATHWIIDFKAPG